MRFIDEKILAPAGRCYYPDCAASYLNLERFGDDSNDEVCFYSYGVARNEPLKEKFSHYKRKVAAITPEPCGLYNVDNIPIHTSWGEYFDEVYSICPYSAKWLDEINGSHKHRAILFPHPLDLGVSAEIPDKPFDVIYWGNVPNQSKTVLNILNTIIKFNHRFYTLGDGVPPKFGPYITGIKSPRSQLWQDLRKSKIMVTSNLLFLTDEHVKAAKTHPEWHKNEAFSHIDEKIAPNIKTRPLEAIFNKTLVLLKEDPWHVFDHWFTPDEDFIYYKNDEDLEGKIREITNDWDDYKPIVENAYNKAIKLYSTEQFVKNIENRALFK